MWSKEELATKKRIEGAKSNSFAEEGGGGGGRLNLDGAGIRGASVDHQEAGTPRPMGAAPVMVNNMFGGVSQQPAPSRSKSSGSEGGGRGGRGGGGGGGGHSTQVAAPSASPRVFGGLSFSEAQFTARGTPMVHLSSPGADSSPVGQGGRGAGGGGGGGGGGGSVQSSQDSKFGGASRQFTSRGTPIVHLTSPGVDMHGGEGGEGGGSESESDGGGATDRSDISITAGEDPVFSRIRHGRVDEVASMLAGGGGDVRDKVGNTPLMVAAQNNRRARWMVCHACHVINHISDTRFMSYTPSCDVAWRVLPSDP